MAEMDDLNALLASLPNASLLTDSMKTSALNISLIPDSAGVWPGEPGYNQTYDIYWAATHLIGFLKAQPVVRQSSSEGTSVSVDAPDWSGLLVWYRSMSPIALATQGTVIGSIPIPYTEHAVRTDMRGRWNGYDNVDTDLA